MTTPDVEEATIKRTVIDNAKESYVLVDASRNRDNFPSVKVAAIEKAEHYLPNIRKQFIGYNKRENEGYRGMIHTVTLNPAIDYIVRLEHVETGSVNRMESDDK